jgi:cell division protein FtsL
MPARPRSRTEQPDLAGDGLALRLLGLARSLTSHRLLDRLIRGRMWIGIVAFALIGIVTLQLGLLRLNSGIGRSLEREASLQRDDAALSIENSELASGTRVETQAERLGMRVSNISSLRFLSSHPAVAAARAAAVLHRPLSPASEPPAGSEASSTPSEEVAPSSAGEPSTAAAPSTPESSTQPGGGSEAQATGTTAEGTPAQAPSTESGAATTPSATGTGAATPAATETRTEVGGGTEAPGG